MLIEAHNNIEIRAILDHVHDREIDTSDICFHGEALSIPVNVLDVESMQSIWNYILINKTQYHTCKAILTFENVTDYEIIDKDQIKAGEINTIRMEGDVISITCGVPIKIVMKVSDPVITLRVSGETGADEIFYNLLFLINVGPFRLSKQRSDTNS